MRWAEAMRRLRRDSSREGRRGEAAHPLYCTLPAQSGAELTYCMWEAVRCAWTSITYRLVVPRPRVSALRIAVNAKTASSGKLAAAR